MVFLPSKVQTPRFQVVDDRRVASQTVEPDALWSGEVRLEHHREVLVATNEMK